MKELTKQEFANTLIELMRHKTIDKITVREICKAAHASTQTFYYHFKDKYDLITWFYMHDVENVWYNNLDKPGYELMQLCYEHILEKRNFYRNGFVDTSDNCLVKHIVEFEIELYKEVLRRKNITIDREMEFIIIYHSYACAEITRYWLLDKNPVSAQKLTELIAESMPPKLRTPLLSPDPYHECKENPRRISKYDIMMSSSKNA